MGIELKGKCFTLQYRIIQIIFVKSDDPFYQ